MPRKYTPRRASLTRWLQDAPPDVLDCFDAGEKELDRFTIFLGKRFMCESPLGWHICYLHCSVDPRGYSGSGELQAHQAADCRYRWGHLRVRWNDLPEAVRKFVERWVAPEDD